MAIEGSPEINGKGIYLSNNSNGASIKVTGTLSNSDKIGVTMEKPGVFTNSTNTTFNDVSKFKSGNSSYIVGKNADGQLLLGAPRTLTYGANGASNSMTDSNSPYASGSSVNVLVNTLTRAGYKFAGWKIGSGTTIYANSADNISGASEAFTISEDTTLTAQWSVIPATVPSISAQPQNLNLAYGYTEGSLSMTATAAIDTNYNLTYQWYSNTTNSSSGGTLIEGATSASYAIPAGKTAGTKEYYYCVVTAARSDNNQTAKTATDVATVTVGKATPAYTKPTGLTATYGQTLANVTLPDGWTWADSSASVGNAGNHTFKASFTPTDTANYSTVNDVDVNVTVNPASVTLTANSGTVTYNGQEQTVTGFTASVDGLIFDGVSASGSGTNTGTYNVTFSGVTVNETRDTSGNYVVRGTTNGTLAVNRAAVTVKADDKSKIVGAEDPELTATVTGLVNGETESLIHCTFSRTAGETVGTYTITPFGEATQGNYSVTYQTGMQRRSGFR